MHYTVYRTVNLVNGKVYVGVHATENPDDAYLGSGSVLKAAVLKYGRASFKKEVLFVFDNPEDMAAKEAELVTLEFVSREDTYNRAPGGHLRGAWYQAQKEKPRREGPLPEATRRKLSLALTGRKLSEETRARMRKPKTSKHAARISAGKLGSKLSEETKAKIGDRHRGKSHPGPVMTTEIRAKISASKIGRPGHKQSEETRRKISEAHLRRTIARL